MTTYPTRKIHKLAAATAAAFLFTALPAQAQAPATGATTPQISPATAPATAPSFEELSQKLLPTVVNVSTTTKLKMGEGPGMQLLPEMPQMPPGSPFEDFFKDFYDRFQNGVPPQGGAERNVSALGSGFVIDAVNGYVVTNNHVIKDADEIKIILHDDTALDAKLIGADDKTDIAVLQVKSTEPLMAAQWGDSDQARVGSWVIAIGNPFGLGGTVTAGIVSARQRNINAGPYDDFIQTDASINRGNSGGPMFNMKGEVIGVNTAIFSPTGGSVGIGFAVPANIARNVVDQLIKYGKTRRGWLGVRIQEVTPDIAESLGLKTPHGALVSSVIEGGPAEKAGIQPGDVLTKFDGQEINQMRSLPRLVAESEVGKKSSVTVWRKDRELQVSVDLGQLETAEAEALEKMDSAKEAPAQAASVTSIEPLELSVAALDDTLRSQYGIGPDTMGVVITEVKPNSAAREKGLTAGDVILEVDQQEVATPQSMSARVAEAVKKGRSSVLLFMERKEDRRFVALKLKK